MKKLNVKAIVLMLILVVSSSDLFAQTRIRFARGRTSASVSGTLYGGGECQYILGARYGQYLTGNISSRGGCVTYTGGSTSFSYKTENGNNYLDLINNCRRSASFTMTVSIRS
ncbi:MAG: hypothetical protein M3Q78_10030 [Acidobacteriota bacterium]|nr:hypothetical protein [Acidobacteriota bacterium]